MLLLTRAKSQSNNKEFHFIAHFHLRRWKSQGHVLQTSAPLNQTVSPQLLNYQVNFYFFTSVLHLTAAIPSPMLVLSHPDRRSGSGDEEGPVSSGRELTLQGAGKSWVGVLPSSDLGLVGGGGAGVKGKSPADGEEPDGEVRDPDGREELPLVEPSSSSSLCSSFLMSPRSPVDLPRLSLPPPRLF